MVQSVEGKTLKINVEKELEWSQSTERLVLLLGRTEKTDKFAQNLVATYILKFY